MSRHHTRLNARRWGSVRRQAFARDRYRCVWCGKAGRLEAHHVRRLEDGGDPYDLTNVIALCRNCHIEHHRPDTMTPGRAEWLEFVNELTGG